ncbi:MAG: DNA polymerase III subunit gamma/tau C-terminal domain-containing protein, partial [Woeseiaceae bacterium]
DGSMRDALSLLDQAIAYCGGTLEESRVARMLGTIDRDHVVRLLRLLADEDAKGIVDAIRQIDEQFPNYGRLLEDLARALQRIAVYQVVGTSDAEDDLDEEEYAELAAALAPEDVQLFYQIAILGRRDLHLSPDPRSGAEMTLLRMLAFRPATSAAGGAGAGRTAGKAKAPAARPASAASAVGARPPQQAAAEAAAWAEPDWGALVAELGLDGAVRLLASNCVYLGRRENVISLGLDPRSPRSESMLTKRRADTLAARLSEHFGEALKVDIELGADEGETPVQEESRLADERLEAARQSLEADPNVQAMKTMFGAELKTDTIELIQTPQADQRNN